MADPSDPEMWRTTPQGGAVAGDAHRRNMAVASKSARKDAALSKRRRGRP
jgi:hypothetical protein